MTDFGTVKNWFEARGFGFLKPDQPGQNDVFVHVSALGGLKELKAGARVSYDIGMSKRSQRPQAANVRVLEPVPAPADDDAVGNQ